MAENWHVSQIKDPVRDRLFAELRAFRKGSGHPTPDRLDDLFDLTEALGEGVIERAFEALQRYYEERGTDPETDIGAYFYLAGWEVGLDSIDQRRTRYAATFHCDISTAWRRAERGLKQLRAVIRDNAERFRPWAIVSVFQSGEKFHPLLDFNLSYESWRPPVVRVNGEMVDDIDFHLHRDPEDDTRYTSRIIMPEYPLDLNAGFAQSMATIRVTWAMPAWPVWNAVAWTADPRIVTRLRTFRQRAVEVSLEWWSRAPANETRDLARDHGVWAERDDPNRFQRPS